MAKPHVVKTVLTEEEALAAYKVAARAVADAKVEVARISADLDDAMDRRKLAESALVKARRALTRAVGGER